MGAPKEATLIVEDSKRGLDAAVAAGVECAIVHNDFTATHDFSQANFFIKKLTLLPDLLKSLDSHTVS